MKKENQSKLTVKVIPNGPYLVLGAFEMEHKDEKTTKGEEKPVALCRCGAAKDKVHCDGMHKKIGFIG